MQIIYYQFLSQWEPKIRQGQYNIDNNYLEKFCFVYSKLHGSLIVILKHMFKIPIPGIPNCSFKQYSYYGVGHVTKSNEL